MFSRADFLKFVAVLSLALLWPILPAHAKPDDAREAYYRRALPAAKSFTARKIAPGLIDPVDRGNESYVEARDGRGAILGYLRDFTGPVSPAEQCPCSPLSLTLVFDAQAELIELLSPQPLQKYGHAPMTAEERAKLLRVCQKPPQSLLDTPDVDSMLDATTGATRRAVKDAVVPQAALSTRRIVGIVRETQEILRGAPGNQERTALQNLIAKHEAHPDTLAAKLAEFLRALSPDEATHSLRQETWRAMARAYAETRLRPEHEGPPLPDVERTLIDLAHSSQIRPIDLAHTCLRVAAPPSGAALLAACEQALRQAPQAQLPPGINEQLAGTRALLEGDAHAAVAHLQAAVATTSLRESPQLHLRLTQALQQDGQSELACGRARALMEVHPRLPGAHATLSACFSSMSSASDRALAVTQLNQELREAARKTFLASGETSGPMRPLKLRSLRGGASEVAPGVANKVTVVVFFATWCPHCRMELPRIRQFVASLSREQRDRVRVLGIRTAFERESEPWAAFARRHRFNFDVWLDGTMSSSFSEFAHMAGLASTLPTTAVLDSQGRVRFQISPGDWGDPCEELNWALQQLEEEQREAAAKAALSAS